MIAFKELKKALDDFIQKGFELYKNYPKKEREILIMNAVKALVEDTFSNAREKEKGLLENELTVIRKEMNQFIENYFKRKFTESRKII